LLLPIPVVGVIFLMVAQDKCHVGKGLNPSDDSRAIWSFVEKITHKCPPILWVKAYSLDEFLEFFDASVNVTDNDVSHGSS